MSRNTLTNIDTATLGNIDPASVFEAQLQWSHFVYQVSHVGQHIRPDPAANMLPAPALRVFGFCQSLKDAQTLRRVLQLKGVDGPVHIGDRAQPYVVLGRTSEQLAPKYQAAWRARVAQAYLDHEILKERMYAQDQLDRKAVKAHLDKNIQHTRDNTHENINTQTKDNAAQTQNVNTADECTQGQRNKQQRDQAYLDMYNAWPWVKMYREHYRVHPDVQVHPGSARIAIDNSRGLHRHYALETLKLSDDAATQYVRDQMEPTEAERAQIASARDDLVRKIKKSNDVVDSVNERTLAANTVLPAGCVRPDQTFFIFSYVLDPSARMEPLIVLYGFCSSEGMARAQQMIRTTIVPQVMPLNVCIYPAGEWLWPYDLGWHENDPVAMPNLQSTSSREDVDKLRQGRHDAQRYMQDKAEELRRVAGHQSTSQDVLLRVLGVSAVQYTDAVNRLGLAALNDALLDLPSVRADVAAVRAQPDTPVHMADIFHAQRTLAPDDYAVLARLFAPLPNSVAINNNDHEAEAFLASVLHQAAQPN